MGTPSHYPLRAGEPLQLWVLQQGQMSIPSESSDRPLPSTQAFPSVRRLRAPVVASLEPDLTAPDRWRGALAVLEKIVLFALGNIT